MGNFESNLLDMVHKGPLEFSHHCHFTVSTAKFPHSPNFEYVAFDIRYDYQYKPGSVLGTLGSGVLKSSPDTGKNTTTRLTSSMDRIGKYIDSFKEVTVFKYFDPTSTRDVIDRVEVFFSVFKPDNPLVIVLTTRDCKKHHYRYRKLDKQPVYFKLAPDHFPASKLKSVLVQENNKLNKKLKFKLGDGKNRNIRMVPENREDTQFLGNSREFKMVSYVPFVDVYGGRSSGGGYGGSTNGPFLLYLPELFRLQPAERFLKNYVDGFYLSNIADQKFDGITVYYTNPANLAVLLEFVSGAKRWQFMRKNVEGSVWRGVSLRYTNDDELLEGLLQIVVELGLVERANEVSNMDLSRPGSIDSHSRKGTDRSVSIDNKSLVSRDSIEYRDRRTVERTTGMSGNYSSGSYSSRRGSL